MLTPRTFIVEMTGIVGAGYPPGLFKPLTLFLRSQYRLNDRNTMRRIVTRFHVDNTAALLEDKATERRATDLILKAEGAATMTGAEWTELLGLLAESDRRFLHDSEAYGDPIDILFRRGGRLQDHVLLHRAPGRVDGINRDRRTTPKLQIFMRADLQIIRKAYEDEHLLRLIRDNPGVYNDAPEEAYRQQQEWLDRVESFTGLKHLTQRSVAKYQYAQELLGDALPLLRAFGFDIRESGEPRDVFISYTSVDREPFVASLVGSLLDRGITVWWDRFELRVGDSLLEKISEGLACSRFGVIVLSRAFLEKASGSWPVTELEALFARQTSGDSVILPIWLGVTEKELLGRFPSLAGRFALDAARLTVDEIGDGLKRKVRSAQ